MDSYIFRRGRWIIDLNENDAINHLASINVSQDVRLIMEYFLYFLFVETSSLGTNEFSERHKEIKDGILDVMGGRYDAGARQLSAVIEGMVKKSLLNDHCVNDSGPYPRWTGTFHKHPEPRNFFQLLEGALRDPRSRIGRTIDYPPEEEVFHVSEMIRNPLAHGSPTVGILEDYKVLFFLLILLFHDIVNPHIYPGNHKYLKWLDRTRTNMRLAGEEPTLDKLLEAAKGQGLDLDSIRKAYGL